MKDYFAVQNLSVGYHGKALIRDIDFAIKKGAILTLIGPNGAGKSTILKTITGQLPAISGRVLVDGQDMMRWSPREMAKQVAVVLTDRVRPELVTCAEVVAMGRYPYTNLLGRMSARDIQAVEQALRQVNGLELAQQDFSALSDGQRQRILLARAICQDPQILVLDEPTAYLDIKHKIELLDILRKMAQEKQVTVILSLHEIDLAAKLSDQLLCVQGQTIPAFGPPEEILERCPMEKLYDITRGSYNPLLGSVELVKPSGPPKVFVVGGGGWGIPVYRELQKRQIPFAAGILFENDVDYQVAARLSDQVVCAPAYCPMEQQLLQKAMQLAESCRCILDAGTPLGALNQLNDQLLQWARERQIPVYTPDQIGGVL